MAVMSTASVQVPLPRVTIKYCTQCRWMLRAAYFAQELLSTFGPPSASNKASANEPPCPTCSTHDGTCAHIPSSTQSSGPSTNTIPLATSLAEVALQPATGGIFLVELTYSAGEEGTRTVQLWDRKSAGGFPETKELKRRVRDHLDPQRDLGHVDRHGGDGNGAG